MATFGENLRAVRHKRGMFMRELAEASGISESAISGYERGKHECTLFALVQLCKTLKCPPQELVEEFPDQEKGGPQ